MPRRGSFGRRLALEAELTAAELEAIAAVCRAVPIPRERWHLCEGVARPFEVLAARRLADRLRAEGRAVKDAHLEACARLGLNPDTIASRLRDWPRAAVQHAAA